MASLALQVGPEEAMRSCLHSPEVTACPSANAYKDFQDSVRSEFPTATQVLIAGSGNWGFSLNPEKNFRPFGDLSDIDVATIDEAAFVTTWENIRSYHRQFYYKIGFEQRQTLRRNGENIYSGFVSPAWIPERTHPARSRFIRITNRLSDERVGFKPVKMLLLRNLTEALDYYKRGLLDLLKRTEL